MSAPIGTRDTRPDSGDGRRFGDGAHRGRADRGDHRRRVHPLRPVAPSPFVRVPPSGSLPAVRFTLALLPLWHVVRLVDLCSFSLQRGRDRSRSVVARSVQVRWRGGACPCGKHLCWVGGGWAGLWGWGEVGIPAFFCATSNTPSICVRRLGKCCTTAACGALLLAGTLRRV